MISLLRRFGDMPVPMKVGLAVVTAGTLPGAAYALFGGAAALIVFICLALVGALAAGYIALARIRKKRKAVKSSNELAKGLSTTPGDMQDPNARAQLDNMRQKFEEGVAKFRAADKDLYSLPWYLMVGEPGSGKTEAVRNCGVGFPPGLQDPYQGAGGTINMDWWFTNQAVILDTAGRMMFQNVEAGRSSEWTEFLKLLAKTRKNCPINGIILVIPVESLIADPAEEIERKAGRIAQQFDVIQRILGVRFPVWVIVTKCDLITGFREFFSQLNQPSQEGQIFGWSFQGDLDADIEPAQTVQNVASIGERLKQWRQLIFADAEFDTQAGISRLARTDALFAFPEEFQQITHRLQRYLDMVFVTGEWSAKPLFFRGIYFTSSMQEGEALDQAVAEALGINVDQYHERGTMREQRSYFLHDLFTEKIFREKGLVTRDRDALRLRRRGQRILIGTGAAAAMIFGFLTWFGISTLEKRIGEQTRMWGTVAQEMPVANPHLWAVVDKDTSAQKPGWRYRDEPLEWRWAGDSPTRGSLAQITTDFAHRRIKVPGVFRFASGMDGDLLADARQVAHRGLIENVLVIKPILRSVRERFIEQSDESEWTPQATAALAELLRIEATAAGMELGHVTDSADGGTKADSYKPTSSPLEIDALLMFVLPKEEFEQYAVTTDTNGQTDQHLIRQALVTTYSQAAAAWPPPAAEALTEASHQVIHTAMGRFSSMPVTRFALRGEAWKLVAELNRLRGFLAEFERAEARLLQTDDAYIDATSEPLTHVDHINRRKAWADALADLRDKRQQVERSLHVLFELGVNLESESLTARCVRLSQTSEQQFRSTYRRLLEALPPETEERRYGHSVDDSKRHKRARDLVALREQLNTQMNQRADELARQMETLSTSLSGYEQRLLAQTPKMAALPVDKPRRPFAIRCAMYETAHATFDQEANLDRISEMTTASSAMDRHVQGAQTRIKGWAELAPDNKTFSDARAVTMFVTRMADREHRTNLVSRAFALAPATRHEARRMVEQIAGAGRENEALPAVKFSSGLSEPRTIDPAFHPDAAEVVFASMEVLRSSIAPPAQGLDHILDRADFAEKYKRDVAPALADYADSYVKYWASRVPEWTHFQRFTDWESYRKAVGGLHVPSVNEELEVVFDRVLTALDAIPRGLVKDETWKLLEERRHDLQNYRQKLQHPLFIGVCRTMASSWGRLSDEPLQAGAYLRGLGGGEFRRSFLDVLPYGGKAPPYWLQIPPRGLDLLATACGDAARQALADLRTRYRGFPIYRDATGKALTEDDVRQANRLAQQIMITASHHAGNPAVADPRVGDPGFDSGDAELNNLIARMAGRNLVGDREAQWLSRVQRVTTALSPEKDTKTIRFRVIKTTIDANHKVSSALPYLKVNGDDDGADITLPGNQGVSLTFKGTDVSTNVTVGAAPWTALQMLFRDGARSVEADQHRVRDAQWLVPVTVSWDKKGGGRDSGTYWLGLANPGGGLPPLDEWPTLSDLPAADTTLDD